MSFVSMGPFHTVVAVGGGIQVRADDVGNDHQIAVRLKAHGQRPQYLRLVKYIDIVVDTDDELDVRIRHKSRQGRLFRLALGAFLTEM